VEHRRTAYARGSSPRSARRSVVAAGGPPTGASDSDSHSSGLVLLLATRCIPSARTSLVDFGRGLAVLHPEDPEACSSDTELMIREREVLFSVH
jgi:hypothetical protein